MNDLNTIVEILGWISIINIGILVFASLVLVFMKDTVSAIHGKMFGINPDSLKKIYINYLANYKILVLVFNIAPYLALKIVA